MAHGMFVRVASAAVVGIEAAPIDVEVDVGVGLPCCAIVGLADAGIREGRLRIRGALENSGFKLPPRRTTVNLAPADLRKDGAAFDVPIAAGMLAAAGAVEAAALDGALLVGELALDGTLRPVRGVLPIAAWARGRGVRRLVVPPDNAGEAAIVGGVDASAAEPRAGGAAARRGDAPAPMAFAVSRPARWQRRIWPTRAGGPRRALRSPPAATTCCPWGAGLGDDARPRLPGILPPLGFEEAPGRRWLFDRRPARRLGADGARPSARRTTLCRRRAWSGGPTCGRARSRSRTTGAVPRRAARISALVLEMLRQPLEDRAITIVRVRRGVTCPADFMPIAALNPCPCGTWAAPPHPSAGAAGSPTARLSGRCSTASTCTSTSPRCRTGSSRTPNRATERRSARASWRRASASRPRSALERAAVVDRAAAGRAARRRRARAAGAGRRPAGPVCARHHPPAPRGTHDRRSGGQPRDRDPPSRRSPPVPRSRSTNDLTKERPCPP
jgi:magnesium chelatase family protein